MRREGRRSLLAVAWAAVLLGLVPAPALAAPAPQAGGVVLDGWGGVHPFGGFQVSLTGTAYWPGWDIARAVTVRDDGSGGWTLDGWGGVHPFGGAPALAASCGCPSGVRSPAYWPGWDIARDLVITSRDASGLPGGVHPFGGAPSLAASCGCPSGARSPAYWPGWDIARDLVITSRDAAGLPDGGWEIRADGTIVNFGAAPAVALASPLVPAVWQHLHANADGTLWGLARWGVTAAVTGTPEVSSWSGYGDWGAWDILRDIDLASGNTASGAAQPVSAAALGAYQSAYRPPGGATLDGWGGLHPWDGYPLSAAAAAYWPGWDIARSLVTREDGTGGWVLDGYGAIHAFGSAPPISSPVYWPGWDIARALVITSHDAHGNLDGRQGYVLDGWGGVHPFGGAPALPPAGYWPNWDIARGLDVHLSASGVPDGLLVLDGWGVLHASGAYPAVARLPVAYPGHDVYLGLQRTNDGRLYAVTRFGQVSALGAQDVETSPWGAPATMAPSWSGYTDYGRWDILRDVAVGRSNNPAAAPQPISPAAADELANRVTDLRPVSLPAPSVRMDKPLDCESAATSAALQTLGSSASQDWVFSDLPVDARPAQISGGRPVMWGDAWTSFVGDVNGSESNFTGYGVYFAPLVKVAADAGHLAFGGQGWTMLDLYAEVVRGHPVVIFINNSYQFRAVSWWTGWDGASVPYTLGDHAVLLYGIDPNAQTVSIMDDQTGTYRAFSMQQFSAFMSTYDGMGVVVE